MQFGRFNTLSCIMEPFEPENMGGSRPPDPLQVYMLEVKAEVAFPWRLKYGLVVATPKQKSLSF